jgi:hypothetical protein
MRRCCLSVVVYRQQSEYKEYRGKRFPALDPLPLLILSTDVTFAFRVPFGVTCGSTIQYSRAGDASQGRCGMFASERSRLHSLMRYRLQEVFPLLHNPGQRQATRYSLKQFSSLVAVKSVHAVRRQVLIQLKDSKYTAVHRRPVSALLPHSLVSATVMGVFVFPCGAPYHFLVTSAATRVNGPGCVVV